MTSRELVARTAMREIPAEALPRLPVGPGIVTARDDSTAGGQTPSKNPNDSSRRDRFRTYDPYRVNV